MKLECTPIVVSEIKLALIDAIQFCMRENMENSANRYQEIYEQINIIGESEDYNITIV